jgi:hypothetical protein
VRIGLEENSCLMAIVDGSWYAQPPDDKRSDDKASWRPRQSHLRIHQKRKMSAAGIPPNSPIAQAASCI